MDQKPHTILVAEDEALIREDISEHLAACGFEVVQAADARQALGILIARDDIDAVFTDVRMPGGMDGIELARWILENHPRIPVLIASGHAGREITLKEPCRAEVFVKPYNPQAVSRKIRGLLATRQSAS